MDMEAGQGEIQSLRSVSFFSTLIPSFKFDQDFVRPSSGAKNDQPQGEVRLNGSSCTATTDNHRRAFFKKWLELEKRLGDEDGIALVKAKAVEWTQRANSS
jgi:hypothetical protein